MVQKLELNYGKKGYLQIDFMFAAVLFFLFFFYIFSYYNSYLDVKSEEFDSQQIQGLTRDLCYLLVNTPGYPSQWEDNDFFVSGFLGLKSTTENELEPAKVNKLTQSKYVEITEALGLENVFLKITISNLEDNTVYNSFGLSGGAGSLVEQSTCYGFYQGDFAKVVVEAAR